MVYYAYGWTLALLNESAENIQYRLFESGIEAWVHGPAIPDLYHYFREYGVQDISVSEEGQNGDFLCDEVDILQQVWDIYGKFSGNQLEVISRKESPWTDARNGIAAYEPSSNQISDIEIFKYFSQLTMSD